MPGTKQVLNKCQVFLWFRGERGRNHRPRGWRRVRAWGLRPTPALLAGCNPRDSTSSPVGVTGRAAMRPILGSHKRTKGPLLCPGSQPNLQDEYVFISQKFLLECAKAFFPLQSRQTRQVYFGRPSHHHPEPACQV